MYWKRIKKSKHKASLFFGGNSRSNTLIASNPSHFEQGLRYKIIRQHLGPRWLAGPLTSKPGMPREIPPSVYRSVLCAAGLLTIGKPLFKCSLIKPFMRHSARMTHAHFQTA